MTIECGQNSKSELDISLIRASFGIRASSFVIGRSGARLAACREEEGGDGLAVRAFSSEGVGFRSEVGQLAGPDGFAIPFVRA